MPTDVITLSALAKELDALLKGGRIDKIYQPEEDEITLSIYTQSGNKTLVISASPNLPRLHITKTKKENPASAPSFCMLLRKHLTSARIESVSIYEKDRNVRFTLRAKNEMADEVTLYLYVELMGRYSNVILTNGENKIFDVLRKIPLDASYTRKLFPSLKYSSPEQSKISVLDSEKTLKILDTVGANFDEIMRQISGFSKETLTELIYLSEKSDDFAQTFINEVNAFINEPAPSCTIDKNDTPLDFYPRIYSTLSSPFISFSSLSEAIDECVRQKDAIARIKSKTKRFTSLIKNAISRTEKKLGANLMKLKECENSEILKIKGEVLTANLYQVKKGEKKVKFYNFYDENSGEIEIELDPTKSPSLNAQSYFRKYTKLKRTKDTVLAMIKENRDSLDYLKGLYYDVSTCYKESDVKDIEENLINYGLLKQIKNAKKKAPQVGKPTKYIFEGIEIYVGRNNMQNDALTFSSALKTDTWLHVKNFHGSHVVVRSGKELSPSVLLFASEIAAFHSESRESDKVDVDYTKIKNVRRSPLKKPGLVIYTDFSTICVKPNEHKKFIVE